MGIHPVLTLAWALGWALLVIWVGALAWALRERATLRRLADAEVLAEGLPPLSIVVAARQEASTPEAAATLREAIRSLVLQQYPQLEVIAVDDRSTDATGEVLRQLAAEHPRLKLLRLESLPSGWLGKPHALYQGARLARGEWLLFTDADVHLAPDAAARAVSYAVARGLGHVTVGPVLEARGLGLQSMLAFFSLLFAQLFPPSLVRAGRVAVGVGAFNLVRADLYWRAGSHAAIRLRVDDDIQLGRLLRRAGARQELLVSSGLVRVPWYPSLPAAIRGFEKNAYAGAGYNFSRFLGQLTLVVLLYLLPPLWALAGGVAAVLGFLLPGWPPAAVASGLFILLTVGVSRDGTGLPWWSALFAPVGACVFTYAFIRSVWLAERLGGIRWRDTFYSLQELRQG